MKRRIYLKFKESADFLISVILVILLSPLFIIISLIVKRETGGTAFFERKHLAESPKGRYKFYDSCTFRVLEVKPRLPSQIHMDTHNLPNREEYLTRSGKFLRLTGLRKLPRLINVLNGEMSFVGPKSAVWDEHELIKLRRENGVATIRPGLVGLVQARGLKGLSPEETAKIDLEYFENMSLWLDIKCFFGGLWHTTLEWLRIR